MIQSLVFSYTTYRQVDDAYAASSNTLRIASIPKDRGVNQTHLPIRECRGDLQDPEFGAVQLE